ncbi:MAG: ABC transporter ATP-binding protein [Anaerolineales bacterium]|nr:MAG: ABC transporter ATP-binding protein [Anaerolineales bacterium]
MLELRDIVKSYQGKPLLRGISFTVAEGETICLLGASGSGKSTILRIISGLEFPESGHLLFNNIDLARTAPHLRDFGLVFQDYGLFPHLNVFENVAFGLKMRSLPTDTIQLRVAALLEQINLTGFEKRNVTDLSGGEQQRIALARALAPQPRLLMFDEPLGALDRAMKEDLLNELRMILHTTKIPAIYVTHDQEEAFTIADRILVLHEGVIVRAGTPDELWKNPESAVVAKFLGVGNVIEGEVISKDKVKTEFGVYSLICKHRHGAGEKVSVLIHAEEDGGDEIRLMVEDVIFKRDQFEVKGRGGLVIRMKDAPKIGDNIPIRVQVKCLT